TQQSIKSPTANPQSAATICNNQLTHSAGFMVNCRSSVSVVGFPGWNLPRTNSAGVTDSFGRQRRKCEVLRASRSAARGIKHLSCYVSPLDEMRRISKWEFVGLPL